MSGRRVLYVSQPVTAGVGAIVAELAAERVRAGWDVAVACPPGPDLAARVVEAGARHYAWPARRSPARGVPAEARRLARILADVGPDLVHLHSSKAGLVGRLVLRGRLPTIFQPNAWSFEAARGPLLAASIRWERLAARWADALICVSKGELDRALEAGIRGALCVVPNGVRLPARETPATRTEARRRLGLDGAPTAVCVGRVCRQKGQDVLIEAWPRVRERVPAAELLLVGAVESEPPSLPAGVLLAGHRDDVPDWLHAADLVVMPSRWEGMSFAMLEAMAHERSVVATDVDGAREAIDGTGSIVPVEDPVSLADAVAERLLDPALAGVEGRRARARVEEHFTFQRTADETAALYLEVLERRGRPAQ